MFDYQKFKKTAYKFKYETLFETDTERVRYGDYLSRVNAVYNALLRLNFSGGTVMLFARTSPDAFSVALACDRAGYRCVITDSKLPVFEVENAVKKHTPALCIGEGRELLRISKRLIEIGCKSVVVTDNSPLPNVFPTEYSLSELVLQNDYVTVNSNTDKKGEFVFAFDDNTPLPDMSFANDIKAREGIVLDIPFYRNAGAYVFCELVYGCHRICFCDNSPKTLKKKKITTLVTAGDRCETPIETVRVCCSEKTYIGGGIFEKEQIESVLSKAYPMPVSLSAGEGKIRVGVSVGADADMEALQFYPPVQALKSVAKEILYPFDVPKMFAFKK